MSFAVMRPTAVSGETVSISFWEEDKAPRRRRLASVIVTISIIRYPFYTGLNDYIFVRVLLEPAETAALGTKRLKASVGQAGIQAGFPVSVFSQRSHL